MVQLYFLSVLFNGFSAYTLIARDGWESDTIQPGANFSPRNDTFRLVLGILTAVTGLLKLLSPYSTSIPFFGDLIPAVGGLAAGFLLVFEFFKDHVHSIDTESKFGRFGEAFMKWKKSVGFILLVSVVLHFLFPQALFL